MKKHAYLIIAHNQPELLKKLLTVLDDSRNDIYIHIDRQAEGMAEKDLMQCCRRSSVFFIPRRHIVWGGESLVLCELSLFKKAAETGYAYYHLISGTDFPIRSQDTVHLFFEQHAGYEFMEFWDRDEKEFLYRIRYRYPLQEKIGRYTNDLPTLALRLCSKAWVMVQKLMKADRVRTYGKPVKCGGEWVSVTDAFVRYLLSREQEIRTYFLKGVAADEVYKQTICWNSPFREKIWPDGHMRLIDWERGSPYTWEEKDLEEILHSDKLFVRKLTEKNRIPDLLAGQMQSDKS